MIIEKITEIGRGVHFAEVFEMQVKSVQEAGLSSNNMWSGQVGV